MEKSLMQDNLSQLKDIKTIVGVDDMSLYYLISLISIILLIAIYISYKYFTKIKKTKKPTKKQATFKKLKNLDYKDTKEIIYSFSVDGFLFVNEKNKDEFERIEKKLETYKYKKEVDKLPQEVIQEIKKFIKGIKNAK